MTYRRSSGIQKLRGKFTSSVASYVETHGANLQKVYDETEEQRKRAVRARKKLIGYVDEIVDILGETRFLRFLEVPVPMDSRKGIISQAIASGKTVTHWREILLEIRTSTAREIPRKETGSSSKHVAWQMREYWVKAYGEPARAWRNYDLTKDSDFYAVLKIVLRMMKLPALSARTVTKL